MRQIEREMLNAIHEGRAWRKGTGPLSRYNTEVVPADEPGIKVRVYLFGNHIATVMADGEVCPNIATIKDWPTVTTLSRLRAMGVNVSRANNEIFLNGRAICRVDF